VLALNQTCTHRQCTISYQPAHYRFYCGCHDNRFTRTGAHLGHSEGVPPLHQYRIEFVDGQIVVDTDTSLPRTPEEAGRLVPIPGGVEAGR
jgi:Rieske Fe-S protein